MPDNQNQITLMQLHEHNVARQQKLDKILELTSILKNDILPKYPKDGVDKDKILEFIDVINITILGR